MLGVCTLRDTRAARLRFLLLLDRCSLADASVARVPDMVLALAAEERQAASSARRAGSALIASAVGLVGLLPGFPWGAGEAAARTLGRRECLASVVRQVLPFVAARGAVGMGGGALASVHVACMAAQQGLAAHPEDLLGPIFAAFLIVGALPREP